MILITDDNLIIKFQIPRGHGDQADQGPADLRHERRIDGAAGRRGHPDLLLGQVHQQVEEVNQDDDDAADSEVDNVAAEAAEYGRRQSETSVQGRVAQAFGSSSGQALPRSDLWRWRPHCDALGGMPGYPGEGKSLIEIVVKIMTAKNSSRFPVKCAAQKLFCKFS